MKGIWQSTRASICLQDVKHPNGSHPPPEAIPYPPIELLRLSVTYTHKLYGSTVELNHQFVTQTHYTTKLHKHMHFYTLTILNNVLYTHIEHGETQRDLNSQLIPMKSKHVIL